MSTEKQRRQFLKGLVLTGGAATILSRAHADEIITSTPASSEQNKQGYHVTDHIQAYYRTLED